MNPETSPLASSCPEPTPLLAGDGSAVPAPSPAAAAAFAEVVAASVGPSDRAVDTAASDGCAQAAAAEAMLELGGAADVSVGPPSNESPTSGSTAVASNPRRRAADAAADAAPPSNPTGSAHLPVLTWPAVIAGMIAVLIILGDVGVRGFAFGTLVAVLPVPFYVALALWLDRYEAEPPRVLARTFVWGATVAVCIAMLVNSYAESMVGSVFGAHAASVFGAVVSAPVVEELAKGLVLLFLYRGMVDEFDGVVDGVVYASMVGLGFAMMENVEYYGSSLAEGGQSSMVTFVVRGMMSPFAHPFFTSMIGIGLGVAREGPRDGRRHIPPMIGLGAAMALHSLWNFVTSDDRWFLGAYVLVMVPAFVGVLWLVHVSLRREGRVVRDHLLPLVSDAVIGPDELERLTRVRDRLAATWRAWRAGGMPAWRARRELHQAASELAFHRWRVQRGISRGADADAERDAEYLARVCELYVACATLHAAPTPGPDAGAGAG
ncbi:MAG: Protease prsW family [Gemmatimonadetes bacterium]|nr:Protease prsW family [Gemmatimonadota bacterium]